jgi:hypothetical protein
VKPTFEQLQHRFSYHPPKDRQAERYTTIREICLSMALFIVDNTPESREQSLALTALDEVMLFSNAAIARNE